MQITLKDFTKSFDGNVVIERMNLEIRDGEMLALLGPSGCGKSTTLLAISGIHRVNGGQILFGDRDVSNLPSQKRNVGVVFQNYALYPHMNAYENIAFPLQVRGQSKAEIEKAVGQILFGDRDVSNLPSQKRNVGVVFQNYALYPHMNAYENIAFPLQVRGQSKAEIEKAVGQIAALTHIEPYMSRRPGQLSGGQQQRVALARALVRRPDVLLLDEPLANLDAKLRLEMRSEIRRIQQETGITAILVTHDQVEAMSMSDRIAIMDQGEIMQISTPDDMYRNPVNRFIAGFMGNPPIVMVDGRVERSGFETTSGFRLPLPGRLGGLEHGRPISIGIRPEHFGSTGSHTVAGTISFVEPQGRESHFDVRVGEDVVLRSIQPSRRDVAVGQPVEWPIDIESTLVFDEQGKTL